MLDAMPDVGKRRKGKTRDAQNKTKARLDVIPYSGLPHATIKRLTPESIDWKAGTIWMPPVEREGPQIPDPAADRSGTQSPTASSTEAASAIRV
jgi:hypothetical protein